MQSDMNKLWKFHKEKSRSKTESTSGKVLICSVIPKCPVDCRR